MTPVLDLDNLVLLSGEHKNPQDGLCFMEAAAYFAGEPHGDHPQCVSPVLGAFLRSWNDSVDDTFRQRLKPFIPRVVGTANDGKNEIRAWMATDWLVRVCTPAWLDLAKLTQHAMTLRTAETIRDASSAARVQPLLDEARRDSAVAWAAARAAAGDAAWAVAWAVARAAAGDAAWAVAWAVARAAARAAAGDAAGDVAWAVAWAAARAAARAALKPTVESLQASALELLDRMIDGRAA